LDKNREQRTGSREQRKEMRVENRDKEEGEKVWVDVLY
jgi:hypothetical protein